MSFRNMLIAVAFIGSSLHMMSQAISKEQLIELHQAGAGDPVLIQQIEHSGISFTLTPSDTIQLKKLGFSDRVLQALLRVHASAASSGTVSTASAPTSTDVIRALYKDGRYSDLARIAEAQVEKTPTDHKMRSILALTYLRLGERDRAQKELDQLNASGEAAQKYASAVAQALVEIREMDQKRDEIKGAFSNFDAAHASELINGLKASDVQKKILLIYVEAFRANFGHAKSMADDLPAQRFADANQKKSILEEIDRNAATYEALKGKTKTYLRSSLAPSLCWREWSKTPLLSSLSVSQYIQVVGEMFRLTPLDPYTLNLMFHAQLLLGDADALQILGDRILKGTGTISIPFYSDDRFFDLVIDARSSMIYTRDDDTPFSVEYAFGALSGWHKDSKNNWNSKLVPFKVSLRDIQFIKQHVARDTFGSDLLGKHAYALRLEPGGGMAPHYGLMSLLDCQAGEAATNHATYALGSYLDHLAQLQGAHPKLDLADPNKKSGNGAATLLTLGVAAASGALNSPMGDMSTSAMLDMLKEQSVAKAAATQNWEVLVSAQQVLVPEKTFQPIETLLDLI